MNFGFVAAEVTRRTFMGCGSLRLLRSAATKFMAVMRVFSLSSGEERAGREPERGAIQKDPNSRRFNDGPDAHRVPRLQPGREGVRKEAPSTPGNRDARPT
jgi:hypothetical protein